MLKVHQCFAELLRTERPTTANPIAELKLETVIRLTIWMVTHPFIISLQSHTAVVITPLTPTTAYCYPESLRVLRRKSYPFVHTRPLRSFHLHVSRTSVCVLLSLGPPTLPDLLYYLHVYIYMTLLLIELCDYVNNPLYCNMIHGSKCWCVRGYAI